VERARSGPRNRQHTSLSVVAGTLAEICPSPTLSSAGMPVRDIDDSDPLHVERVDQLNDATPIWQEAKRHGEGLRENSKNCAGRVEDHDSRVSIFGTKLRPHPTLRPERELLDHLWPLMKSVPFHELRCG